MHIRLDFRVKIVFSNGQNYARRFIDIEIDVSMQRVLKRHIATGLLYFLWSRDIFQHCVINASYSFFVFLLPGKEPEVAAWRVILSS